MYRKIGVIGLIVSMLLIGCGTKSQSTQSSSQAEGKDGGAREINIMSKAEILSLSLTVMRTEHHMTKSFVL